MSAQVSDEIISFLREVRVKAANTSFASFANPVLARSIAAKAAARKLVLLREDERGGRVLLTGSGQALLDAAKKAAVPEKAGKRRPVQLRELMPEEIKLLYFLLPQKGGKYPLKDFPNPETTRDQVYQLRRFGLVFLTDGGMAYACVVLTPKGRAYLDQRMRAA